MQDIQKLLPTQDFFNLSIFKLTTIFSTPFKKTQVHSNQNASAFEVKHKCVSTKTQGRLSPNASAF